METARSFYDAQQHRSLILQSAHDHEVACLTYEARALWFLGYPNQALTRISEALDRARKLSHPFSLARALVVGTFVHQYRREIRQVREQVEELLAPARAHGFAMWDAVASVMQGWALTMDGQEDGLIKIKQGLQGYVAVGSQNGNSYHRSLLIEA
jgi:predicted ATPase